MHHLLLLVVLFGWILFLFLSWQLALPLYVIAVIISLVIYWKIMQAQRNAPMIGKRKMIGDQAVVFRVEGDVVEAEYEGEIWRVVSTGPLQKGQRVIIKGVDGLVLKVAPLKPGGDASA
ncbi:MAG TPA: NfeD family protein [Thermodesulfobacteriota bacterium]|nr:NfeD family protein [Thermodesulfobacteriota bacterium]